MTLIRFNAITYANRLKNAGLASAIADVEAEEMSNLINNDLASKQDLLNVELKLLSEIKNLKNEMIVKLGSLMIAGIVVLGLIIKL